MQELAIAIIFFEKLDQTIECINSAVERDLPIYVLNNNSSNKSAEKIKEYYKHKPNILFFDAPENLGPAKGRNFLIENIKEPWIFFLDNDITIKTKGWLNKIDAHILAAPDTEVFIPRLFNVHENEWVEYHEYELVDNKIRGKFSNSKMTNWFPGGASIVNRKLFSEVGLYNNSINVLEDIEISVRALMHQQPIKAQLVDDIELIHDHQFTKDNKDRAAIKTRYAAEQYLFAENYIREFHKIEFYSGWKEWVNVQLDKMIYNSQYQKSKRWFFQKITAVKRRIKD